jgi:integrase
MPSFKLGPYSIERRKGTANWQRTWRDDAGVKQRASLGTPDFEQAKERLAEWFIEHGRVRNQPSAETPIASVLSRYFLRHGTKIPSKDVAKRSVAIWSEFWGDRVITDMTVDAQEEFVAWLRGKGYSEGYVRRVVGVGQAALNRAWKRQEVTEVPWIELPPIGEPYPHTASLDQIAAFLNAIPDTSHLWTYCMIRLCTGCRGDAALDLQPFQLDWDASLIRLNPEGRQQTKKYRPIVPLTAALKRELSGISAGYYVNWHGQKIGSIKKSWAKVRAAAKLPVWFAPKVLRHTVATELRRRGVPHWEVSGQIGHKKAGTSEIYAKFDPDYLGAARIALDAWMDDLSRKVPRLRGQSGVSHMRKVVGGTRIELVTPTMSRLGKKTRNNY